LIDPFDLKSRLIDSPGLCSHGSPVRAVPNTP
jgi:hypothetical protein